MFDGYTGGGNKELIDGLMSTGDVGHFDEAGRLFIDGRDDEMIVSGGENVFQREVEDLLSDHDQTERLGGPWRRGQGVRQGAAARRSSFLVTAPSSARMIQAYVKQNLARYKVPREVVFLERLPRNATGKILKASCARL